MNRLIPSELKPSFKKRTYFEQVFNPLEDSNYTNSTGRMHFYYYLSTLKGVVRLKNNFFKNALIIFSF